MTSNLLDNVKPMPLNDISWVDVLGRKQEIGASGYAPRTRQRIGNSTQMKESIKTARRFYLAGQKRYNYRVLKPIPPYGWWRLLGS